MPGATPAAEGMEQDPQPAAVNFPSPA